ncbi:hypothetical protein BDZ89DRAFT_155621 [Hymenopellis radicata]|nr:hypothetical protein BDZ89DRAFT_155621 [Hymenopellis radicata]
MKKETAEDDPLAKAMMSRSSFDAILAALPALSAEAQNSDVFIHKRYRLVYYSSLPHLPSCLFSRGLLVIPDDAIFHVLYLLWCYTQQNPSRLRALVDANCVHLPPWLVSCFLRIAKRSPSRPSPSTSHEPMSMSTSGPNARCSYLAGSVSSRSGFPKKSVRVFQKPTLLSCRPLRADTLPSLHLVNYLRLVNLLIPTSVHTWTIRAPSSDKFHRKLGSCQLPFQEEKTFISTEFAS